MEVIRGSKGHMMTKDPKESKSDGKYQQKSQSNKNLIDMLRVKAVGLCKGNYSFVL